MRLPKVRLFNAVSVDGRMDHLVADMELFYGLAMQMRQDAVLTGSGTIMAAIPEIVPEESAEASADVREGDERPWFVVVDGKGQVRSWHMFRHWPYFRGVLALVAESTPREYLDYLSARKIGYIVAGRERVDLRGALAILRKEHGVKEVRVDSGGKLNGALLRQGLVDEVHVLIHPELLGGLSPSSMFQAPDLGSRDGAISLELRQVRRPEPSHVWLRYQVLKDDAQG